MPNMQYMAGYYIMPTLYGDFDADLLIDNWS